MAWLVFLLIFMHEILDQLEYTGHILPTGSLEQNTQRVAWGNSLLLWNNIHICMCERERQRNILVWEWETGLSTVLTLPVGVQGYYSCWTVVYLHPDLMLWRETNKTKKSDSPSGVCIGLVLTYSMCEEMCVINSQCNTSQYIFMNKHQFIKAHFPPSSKIFMASLRFLPISASVGSTIIYSQKSETEQKDTKADGYLTPSQG